jgi:serine/threonine-protein kinase
MIGKQLGRYTILEQIAAGGMGVVYRARDERLHRDVALKVLPTGTLDEQTRQRFRTEALTLSQLSHANVCVVHDFDTADGVDFLVMELVTGGTLAQHIAGSPLPEREVVALGAQIADALDEAHGSGIVHRDLKPGNVMLTARGQAKVLDFGLARWIRPAGDQVTAAMTRPQTMVGTLPYMSPEQVNGKPADVRSDTYALGVVLYEMATGRVPFTDANPLQLTEAIQKRPPVPPRTLTPEVPEGLEHIILKCLEKNPEHRYQSAREIAVDLRRLVESTGHISGPVPPVTARRRSAPVLAAILVALAVAVAWPLVSRVLKTNPVQGPSVETAEANTVVVLPFENLGPPEDQYFADGITEEITSRLAQISGLKVASRTSAVRVASQGRTLREIGTALGVACVLEGTIRTDRDSAGTGSVRVTPQLIRVADDTHLWADRYTVDLVPGEIFRVQAEIAEQVARALDVTLLQPERKAVHESPTESLDAYDAYLLGRFHWNKRQRESVRQSAEYFRRAIAADSTYARGYAGLADAYLIFPSYQVEDIPMREALARAEAAAGRAIALDSTLAEAHASYASAVWSRSLDLGTSEREFMRALELDPCYAVAHYWYGETLMAVWRLDEALDHLQKAVTCDPASPIAFHLLGWCYRLLERYDEGIAASRQAIALEPGFLFPHINLAAIHVQQGRFEEARNEMRQTRGIPVEIQTAVMDGLSGRIDRAAAAVRLRRFAEAHPPSDLVIVANFLAWLGDREGALDYLERAIGTPSPTLIWAQTMPGLISLRGDPRFEELLRRIGVKQGEE